MKNWKKYSFEFILIFTAVFSAFALSNWNDNRRSHHAENKILTEIHKGLTQDIEDLQLNASGHKKGIEAVAYFKQILSNTKATTDSISVYYSRLTRDFVSIQNTSGYEALKSKGLELIENDALRSDIISLYEYDYALLRKLEEDYHETQFYANYFNNINQIIAKHFVIDSSQTITGIHMPLEISVNEEKELHSYLWKIETNRQWILNYYADIISKTESVKQKIGAEIE